MDDGTGIETGEESGAQRELTALRASLHEACAAYDEWPAQVAAAVYSALEFAAADPDRALRLLARDGEAYGDDRAFEQTVDCLNRLLEKTVPVEGPPGGVSGSVQGIALIVSDHLRAERVEGLAGIGPALVQFALQPYLGYVEAKQWATRAS
jgi:hypothetical protein